MPREVEAKEASPESFQPRPHSPLTAWHALLDGIRLLAQERGLIKKAFISYTWPPAVKEREALDVFLKRLQNEFERAGIQTFLDVRDDIPGNMDVVIHENIAASDFVLPILTPAFLAGVEEQGAKPNNLQFQFQLMMEKAKANPDCLLPILHAGEFRDVYQGPLAPLAKQLLYRLHANTRLEPYLVELSDPLGLIPVMYGIRFNDPAYQALLLAWLESSLTSLPQPLPNAIARENQMADLFLSSQQPRIPRKARGIPSSIQIIQGMGGIGKTQLAILYANRQTQEKQFVRWMPADKEHLENEWQRLGELLGLYLKGHPLEEQHRAIQLALSQRKHWLLVLENVENKAALKGLLPPRLLPTQQVLITTRSQQWGNDPVLALPPFTLEECQTYFETRLTPPQCVGVEDLTQELGALPLAIAHAVAYMQQTGKTAKNYLELYQEKGVALLAKEGVKSEANDANYNATVLTTYQLSITSLASKHPKAAELVTSCAYFHPEDIKKSFLKKLLNLDEEAFDDCMRAIRKYSLLSKGNTGFNMHRLVQQVIRHQLTAAERESQMIRVAQCLTELNPGTDRNDAADDERRKTFMPHLKTIITHHKKSAIKNEHLALALEQLGNLYYYLLDQPQRSVGLYEHALKIKEMHYGKDHYEMAITLNNLGHAYGDLGDTEHCRDLLERALVIQEAHYGKEHYEVVPTLISLGNAYSDLGDTARQRNLLEHALAIKEAHYGQDHYQVAITLVSLGIAYGDLGNTVRPRDLLERALIIQEAHYGRDHYQVAITLANLGKAYGALGNAARKRDLLERALAIKEAHYGRDHYQVAITLTNLGKAYGALGDTSRKRDLLERALVIKEAHYGQNHYEVAIALGNLGIAYGDLGDAAQKCDLLERALAMQEAYYGRNHYQVAITLVNLGIAYGDLEDTARQRDLLERALAIKEAHYGRDHYQVAIALVNLGIAYGNLGDIDRQRDLLERALAIKERHYGRDHSELAITLTHLAAAYRTLKQQHTALHTAQRAYRILMNHPHCGVNHPRTKQCINYLESACHFSLEDLQGKKALSDKEAFALNHYPGTLVNQRQRRKIGVASKEQKSDQRKTQKKCLIS
jgi:tetratricopeptide (TPR) repeat protein